MRRRVLATDEVETRGRDLILLRLLAGVGDRIENFAPKDSRVERVRADGRREQLQGRGEGRKLRRKRGVAQHGGP